MIEKKTLRKTLLQYRRLLSDVEFEKRNQNLQFKVRSYIQQNDFKSVHCFLPIAKNKEPDLTGIFRSLWSDGRRIMVSVTNFETKSMSNYWLEPETRLETNHIGIPEPLNAREADIDEADLILVPLLAADKTGGRIGYGGGFYDRLLENFKGDTLGVSLASLFDKLGTDRWDVPVRHVLFYRKIEP